MPPPSEADGLELRTLTRNRDTECSSGFVGPAVDDEASIGARRLANWNVHGKGEARRGRAHRELRAERTFRIGGYQLLHKWYELQRPRAQVEYHALDVRPLHDDLRRNTDDRTVGV